MSTIVVVKKNGRAVIAADAQVSFGNLKFTATYNTNTTKLLRHRDGFLGVVGAASHHNVLEDILRRYEAKFSFDNTEKIFQSYLKMHKILKDEYYVNPKDEDEDPYESSRIDALIANPHGIFGMYSLRSVYEFERFWATGSGMDFALGAMFALYDRLETAEEIAAAGIAAGCEFDDGSGLPLTIETIELAKAK